MVNKEFEAFKFSIVKAIDFSASKDELEKLKKIILDYNNNPLVDEKNKVNEDYLSFDKLYLSQNDKTGPHTINMNISSGFYCYECIKGHCNVQDTLNSKKGKFDKIICYSLANNNRLAITMTYGLINYIVFNTLPIDELVLVEQFISDNLADIVLDIDNLTYSEIKDNVIKNLENRLK